jgi:GMP synthase-like glutamine amidotransferase
LALLIGAAALLVVFFLVERASTHPMLDLRLFRKPTFVGASIAAFALSCSLFSLFLYMTLWIQGILGLSPLQAGARFLPSTLLAFVFSPIGGRLTTRVPMRLLMGGGLALVGIGLLLMTGVTANSQWTVLLPGFIVTGIGVGLLNPALASTAVGVVPPEQSGMASGINSTFRQVGISTGVAALGAIFQHGVRTHILGSPEARSLGGHVRQFADAVSSGAARQALSHVPGPARGGLHHLAASSFATALDDVFLIGAVIALAGSVLTALLVRQRDLVGGVPGEAAPGSDGAGPPGAAVEPAGPPGAPVEREGPPGAPVEREAPPQPSHPARFARSPAWAVIQHVEFEGPGLIAPVAARHCVGLDVHCLYAGDSVPRLDSLGGLVVMGGPMSAGDTPAHPHLAEERALMAEAVEAGLPVLGVCLGAQLLARALGAGVFRGEHAEVGLGEVELTREGRADPILGPAGSPLPVLHWHQDTFDLPEGAVRLAGSHHYPNQAFRVGPLAYGLQFHVELDRELAAQLRHHLPAGVELPDRPRERVERAGWPILDRFFALAASRPPKVLASGLSRE